ncbi:hypothetical protein [Aureibacillus halotolerans]|nr:hypothetical protein [Aureibacillus halotolerans]
MARQLPLLMLDEPFAGIDIMSRDRIIDALIKRVSDDPDQTVLLCSQEIRDLGGLLDYVVFLDQGKVVLTGEVEQLRREHGSMTSLYRKLATA